MKRTHTLIFIYVVIFIIINILFLKNKITISIPLPIEYYFSFLSIFLWSFFWVYKWMDLKDLHEDKQKHLWYLRIINDRIWKKIDWNFFTDIEKAKKFCDKEEYYIIPYGYRYNISEIDFSEIIQEFDKNWEEKSRYTKKEVYEKFNDFDEILLELSKEEIDENLSVKNFIEIDTYISTLEKKWKNNFNLKDIAELEKINERIFVKDLINLDSLKEIIRAEKDFIIIEWYYYLYRF